MEWLDKIREFIQQILSSELIQKIMEILGKIMEILQKLWEWLYGAVTGLFR